VICYFDPARVEAFARAVAQHLPEKFEVQKVRQEVGGSGFVLVNGDERIALVHRTYGERDNDRISFKGLPLDVDLSNSRCLGRMGSTTTAALTRSPKAVASQIIRNLLPHYRAQLEGQRSSEAERKARKARRSAEAERVAALLPGGGHVSGGTDRFYDHELVTSDGPSGKASLAIYANRDGLSYTLSFGQDDAFCADLIELLRKHSSR